MTEVKITTVRLPQDIAALLSRVAENRGETVSLFVRRSVLRELAHLSYLSRDQKKSLGISESDELHTYES